MLFGLCCFSTVRPFKHYSLHQVLLLHYLAIQRLFSAPGVYLCCFSTVWSFKHYSLHQVSTCAASPLLGHSNTIYCTRCLPVLLLHYLAIQTLFTAPGVYLCCFSTVRPFKHYLLHQVSTYAASLRFCCSHTIHCTRCLPVLLLHC